MALKPRDEVMEGGPLPLEDAEDEGAGAEGPFRAAVHSFLMVRHGARETGRSRSEGPRIVVCWLLCLSHGCGVCGPGVGWCSSAQPPHGEDCVECQRRPIVGRVLARWRRV